MPIGRAGRCLLPDSPSDSELALEEKVNFDDKIEY